MLLKPTDLLFSAVPALAYRMAQAAVDLVRAGLGARRSDIRRHRVVIR